MSVVEITFKIREVIMRFKILGLCVLLMAFSVHAEATTYTQEQLQKMLASGNLPEQLSATSVSRDIEFSYCVLTVKTIADAASPGFLRQQFRHRPRTSTQT